jgi:phosphoribosyl 1,2-cyclic phosphodiesterase
MDEGENAIVQISVLASSSAGNSALVATARTRLLVDAGLSRKETFERLAAIGVAWDSIDAILITHEHTDHVSGLQAIAGKLNDGPRCVPTFISRLTAPSIGWGERVPPPMELFQSGGGFTIGDIEVSSFTIPHDAIDPVAFTFRAEGVKIAIATDLGYIPASIRMHLCGCDVVLLESNHDLEMLKVGPYPWSVKQRVMGRMGHLSNEVACAFLRAELDTRTSTVILGHLSEHNNHPAIVQQCAARALEGRELFTRLLVADPRLATETIVY